MHSIWAQQGGPKTVRAGVGPHRPLGSTQLCSELCPPGSWPAGHPPAPSQFESPQGETWNSPHLPGNERGKAHSGLQKTPTWSRTVLLVNPLCLTQETPLFRALLLTPSGSYSLLLENSPHLTNLNKPRPGTCSFLKCAHLM